MAGPEGSTAKAAARVGLIGLGYWGRNLARVFDQLGALSAICDRDAARLAEQRALYPQATLHATPAGLLADPAVTAVAIAAPPDQHAELARVALESGRDAYVEKPLCHTYAEAEALGALATRHGRVLMVGHLLRYHAAFTELRGMVRRGVLGGVRHVEARRLNHGRIYTERNVLWNFAPHDLSLVLAVLGDAPPDSVACHGHHLLAEDSCDVATLTLRFAGGATASVTVSWISPIKEARLTVFGSSGGAVFDDTRPWPEKLAWFDGHTAVDDGRRGRAHLPAPRFVEVAASEPLVAECSHFLACCADRTEPVTGPAEAARVVAVLDAAQRSMDAGGAAVRVC